MPDYKALVLGHYSLTSGFRFYRDNWEEGWCVQKKVMKTSSITDVDAIGL